MSNIDKRAQKELYAKVEQQAHSLRGNPREYQVVTGLCPVNVIEMHAKKIQALLDELEAKDKLIAELEAKLETADKLQDSAFRHGLQHGFSLGQTDNQAGFEECLSAYGTGKGE
jgi:hypothetical protein